MSLPEFEKYKINRKICKKFCYALYDGVDKMKCYVKILDEGLARDPVKVYHFLNGARMSSLLKDHAICKIYDYGKLQNCYFVVSEPINFKPLSLFIHEEFPLKLDRVVDLVVRICEPLRNAHLSGMAHGMFNPGCIYVANDGSVKIDDFGYAWLTPYLLEIEEAEAIYLAYYIAPELFTRPGKIDGRADMYSLGVILLQMLIDYVPLHHLDKSPQNKRYGVNVETWRNILNGHPKGLKTILYKLLDRNPENRFSNLREIIKEFKLLKKCIPSAPSESNLSQSPFRTLTRPLEGF